MDTRRLLTFVRIVDIGSLTRAAAALHVAQPALSQQIQALEAEVGQPLLIRSKQGVTPTEAGSALYRHAQVILKQVADALADVEQSGREIAGQVSLGLAPYSTANLIALPLLRMVRDRYPRIRLRISDNFGAVLSEAMTAGRLDMAILYDTGPIPGVELQRLISEDLVLVAASSELGLGTGRELPLERIAEVPLMLPAPVHTIHKAVVAACDSAHVKPMVVAELESEGMMGQAVREGLGATILPRSLATRIAASQGLHVALLTPPIQVHLSLGTPSILPLSRAADQVRTLLREAVESTLV